MNVSVAAERLATIIRICKFVSPPERQVDILCSFAKMMPTEIECVNGLLAQASSYCSQCSSAYLRANALVQITAVTHSLGMDTAASRQEIFSTIYSISTSDAQFGAIIDAAKSCAALYPELASQLLQKAVEIAPKVADNWPPQIERLNGLPLRPSSQLLFEFLKRKSNYRRVSDELCGFASHRIYG